MPTTERKRVTSPALRRGLDILELFLHGRDELSVPEITETLALPRASVHELITTLADRNYLRIVGDKPTRVRLGAKTFQLGGAYERSLDLSTVGRDAARRIAHSCGETVQIVVLDEAMVTYVVRVDSTHAVRLVSEVGSRLPATCTAGGKLLLSNLDDARINQLFPDDGVLPRMTEHSIATVDRLRGELAETRDRGWGQEYCESNPDVACVAAPIYDASGHCVAAMSISVPTSRWDQTVQDRLLTLVLGGARGLSTELGA